MQGILRGLVLWVAVFTQAWAAEWVVSLPATAKVLQPVLGPDDHVHVLLPSGTSPHHWQMKPSQLKWLAQADRVVIVDSHMEAPVARWLKAHRKPALVWHDVPGIRVLPAGETGEALSYNPHLWLSFHNIAALWQALQSRGWVQQRRVQQAQVALYALDSQIEKVLLPVKETPYVVLHDAFAYFDRHYRLNKVGVVDLDAGTPLSLKQFYAVRKLLQQKRVRCVLYPETHNVKVLKRITLGLQVRLQGLDALGWRGKTLAQWFMQLAQGYRSCLQP